VGDNAWSRPTKRRWIRISRVSQDLKPGAHVFEVKAIDTENNESKIKSIEFYVKENTPPRLLYLQNIWNYYLTWLGKDAEDGYRVKYSYRIDKGRWSKPSRRRWLQIKRLRLRRGKHIFELKAIDREGLESKVRSIIFIKH